MLLLGIVLAVSSLGSVLTETCAGPRRYLATTGATPSAYIWPGEEVHLYCRPSRPGGCRWLKGDAVIGNDCLLATSATGTIRCKQGEEVCGSFQLQKPNDMKIIEFARPSRGKDRYNRHRRTYSASPSYSTASEKRSAQDKGHLCSNTGTIIKKSALCDGTDDCGNGEDEEVCTLPCGPPAVRDHSSLATPAREVYPDGSKVTYTCQRGFSFRETLSGLNRTCQRGRWSAAPPVCHRSVAFGRPVTVAGAVMTSQGQQVVVDGLLDTWCIFMPTSQPQSLMVASNDSVERVLVRSLSARYRVSVGAPNGTATRCSCSPGSAAAAFPQLSKETVCTCADSDQPGPTEVVISSEPDTFMALAVAELAALAAARPEEPGDCALLDRPAHGSYQPAGDASVRLTCQPGYGLSCPELVSCAAIADGSARPTCLPLSCPPPPTLPHTAVRSENGTGWAAVTEYGCDTGYEMYPAEQTTASVCTDGLWSLSHLSCLPDSDFRVVTLRLGQQHARSVAALRGELEALLSGQLQLLLRQQNQTQQRLQQLETGLQRLREEVELQQLQEEAELQQQNQTHQRLQQLETGLQRFREEVELQRLEEEAELQRLQEEVELKQLQGDADQQWLEEEAELQQLEEETDQQRLEEEAELQQLQGDADQQRLEEEAELQQLEREAGLDEDLEQQRLEDSDVPTPGGDVQQQADGASQPGAGFDATEDGTESPLLS